MSRGRMWVIFLFTLLVATILPANVVHAATTYYVATSGSDSNPGTSALPWQTIQHGVDTIASGDTLVVKNGSYMGEILIEQRWTLPTTIKAQNHLKARLQNTGVVVKINGATNVKLMGFNITAFAVSPGEALVYVDWADGLNAQNIEINRNVIHDAKSNTAGRGDLLKSAEGVDDLLITRNVFYNQASGEEAIDLNSVNGAVVEDNIFFHDYAASGKPIPSPAPQSFITVKDSLGDTDGLLGSRDVFIQRNIFANWQGGEVALAMSIGNDGKPYHEAIGVEVVNNLILGNSTTRAFTAFQVEGAKDVMFHHNTVTGDLPNAGGYAALITKSDLNPNNENVTLTNNIWSDATGTLGQRADLSTRFITGATGSTTNLVFNNNLYYNAGNAMPTSGLLVPSHDAAATIADPGLATDHSAVILPWYNWTTKAFVSGTVAGNLAIEAEFDRLVDAYAAIPSTSPAIGLATDTPCPATDIRGDARPTTDCDVGAVEYP